MPKAAMKKADEAVAEGTQGLARCHHIGVGARLPPHQQPARPRGVDRLSDLRSGLRHVRQHGGDPAAATTAAAAAATRAHAFADGAVIRA